MMLKRKSTEPIERLLRLFPVVGLVGARQVGKTLLAKNLALRESVYLDLELPSDAHKLGNAELYLSGLKDKLVIIDEVQRMPSLFPLIRALVDQNRRPGRFLLLGSASPEMIRNASESLAGRIAYKELTPFMLSEVLVTKFRTLWRRGGFPNSFLSKSDTASLTWREAFIKTYLEQDIPQLGIQIPAAHLRRFWTMLAHLHGQLWNASHLAQSLGISPPTARHYLDILEGTFIVRQLAPYYVNTGKRLVKSPKVYIRDSGLLHALLNLPTEDAIAGHPVAGFSWEGFVIEQIAALMPPAWKMFFYRTAAGAEMDLVLVTEREQKIGIEIKYSLAPKPAKGFWHALRDLKCKKTFIVYPGKDRYPVEKNVEALPVEQLQQIFD